MKSTHLFVAVAAICLPLAAVFAQAPSKPAPAKPTYKDVAAFFTANCMRCHTGERAPRQIDLSSYQALMEGGETGPVVKPGAPKHSLLIRALRGDKGLRRMPPRGEAIPEEQIQMIETWIRAGAKP